MRVSLRVIVFLLSIAGQTSAQRQAEQPPTQLKEWKVSADSADISSDGTLVAAAFLGNGSKPESWVEKVQFWSPKDDQIIGEFRFRNTQGTSDPYREHMLVRFGPDRHHVYAYIAGTLYILSLSNPDDVVHLPLNRPHDSTAKSGKYTFPNRVHAKAMEISPSGDAIAILWSADLEFSKAEIYELPTGKVLASVPMGANPEATQHSIAWTSDGKVCWWPEPLL